MTSMPLLKRTRATLRSAEFGFFGVVVYTRTHTPRFCGQDCNAGDLVFLCLSWRPLQMSWLIVGMRLQAREQLKSCSLEDGRKKSSGRTGGRGTEGYSGSPDCQATGVVACREFDPCARNLGPADLMSTHAWLEAAYEADPAWLQGKLELQQIGG